MINYSIEIKNPKAHLIQVTCTIEKPDPNGQVFSLPTWLPGSYMIRDFAKHIVQITVKSETRRLTLKQINKSSWQAEVSPGPLEVSYQVYAWELNPRGAHVDEEHAFFDGSRVFMRIHGFELEPCQVTLEPGFYQKNPLIRVATAMPLKQVDDKGFGSYQVENYRALIDHPFEIGLFERVAFNANEIPHEIVVSGGHKADLKRLSEDVERICQAHMDLFGLPWPTTQYLFLLTALNNGYGGLEHRASSTLLCSWRDMPVLGQSEKTKEYIQLLGLFSHEYFHTWNVKKIMPKVVRDADLSTEVYTRQLWIFEGITSYFDDFQLCYTQLISIEQYLELLSNAYNRINLNPGTFVQDLETSSFEAWTKFYKQDENSPNAIVSYYVKGAFVALILDLTIRSKTNHQWSLAKVMRSIWISHGKDERGLEEGEFESLAQSLTGCDLSDFFEYHLRTAKPLLIEEAISPFGLELVIDEESASQSSLGFKTMPTPSFLIVSQVLSNTPAEKAGLAANDELVAIDELQVNGDNLDTLLTRYAQGDELSLHVFRQNTLRKLVLNFSNDEPSKIKFQRKTTMSQEEKSHLSQWLGRWEDNASSSL